MDKLKVLILNHLIQRKRRYIVTLCELCIPIALIAILVIYKSGIQKEASQNNTCNSSTIDKSLTEWIDNDLVPLSAINFKGSLMYYPKTNQTDIIMTKVAQNLGIQHKGQSRRLGSLENEAIIQTYVDNMHKDDAVIVFHNLQFDGDTPTWLDYTIRTKNTFRNRDDKHLRIYENPPQHGNPFEMLITASHFIEEPEDDFRPLLKLQWAIDNSFLQLMTRQNVPQTLYLTNSPESRKSWINTAIFYLMASVRYGPLIPYLFLGLRLVKERTSGLKELIRIAGVSRFIYNLSHFLNMVPFVLIYSVVSPILLKVTERPLVPYSNVFFISIALGLNMLNFITFSFVVSSFFYTSSHTFSIHTLIYMIVDVPYALIMKMNPSVPMQYMIGLLLPGTAMNWFFAQLLIQEIQATGITWSNVAQDSPVVPISVMDSYLVTTLQIILYFFLVAYLEMVRPGPYGIAEPWNALCVTQRKKTPALVKEGTQEVRDPQYFEDLPPNAEIGIKVTNVSKIHKGKKKYALRNLSLDIMQGEILVLLGHNGAGKTTLMSIITGMTSPTEGKVLLNGLNVASQRNKVGKELGWCPQHNLFIDHLTVKEQVIFFAKIKGISDVDAKKGAAELLNVVDLSSKADTVSYKLSGGMKRRLQLACALAGDPKLLILDEPTSGLDVETRRELWNLLLSLRGSRTILLTTHFMEEADALGDRIAALNGGVLRSYATPLHLKKSVGGGYRLTLTTKDIPKEAEITALVHKYIPQATLKEKSLNFIEFNLPIKDSSEFKKLFEELEKSRPELNILSISVGATTLDEVFIKLCGNVKTNFVKSYPKKPSHEPVAEPVPEIEQSPVQPDDTREIVYISLPPVLRCCYHFRLLFMRHIRFLIFYKFSVALPIFLLPLIFIALLGAVHLTKNPNENLEKQYNFSTSKIKYPQPFRRVLAPELPDGNLQQKIKDIKEVPNDFTKRSLRLKQEHHLLENKYFAEYTLKNTSAKVISEAQYSAATTALNLLSNLVALRSGSVRSESYPSEAVYPLINMKFNDTNVEITLSPLAIEEYVTWNVMTTFAILFTVINAKALPLRERLTGTRRIHIMSGASVITYWLTTLIFYTIIFNGVLVVPILIVGQLDCTAMFNQRDYMAAAFILMELALLAMQAFCFFVSMFGGGKTASNIVLFLVFITVGFFTGISVLANISRKASISLFFYYTLPSTTFTRALLQASVIAYFNAYCRMNYDQCKQFKANRCCNDYLGLKYSYWTPGRDGITNDYIILCVQFLFYMTLVFLLETGICNKVLEGILNRTYIPQRQAALIGESVVAERNYVADTIKKPPAEIPDVMLTNNIYKRYWGMIRKFEAVKGVSLSVKKGECFGLLGVNGAGKSTMFKIITAELFPSKGTLFANGYHYSTRHHNQYIQSLGYCPQFFGLDEFLTGRENLTLILSLRGLSEKDVKKEVEAWTDAVGLTAYIDQTVKEYSGGCKRRMSCAASLCSGAPVSLLDEPTTGVDVAARRRVWSAIKRALRSNRSMVITSHSMDEMEALCDRIAIMVNGAVQVLGTPVALRTQHAPGHSLVIKLLASKGMDKSAKVDLKNRIKEVLNCTLKDENWATLRYHINETMVYNDLFSILEALKQQFENLIEDYTVTETTLEEVFLSVAKENRESKTQKNIQEV